MTLEERNKLINDYALCVVNDMDIEELCRYVADVIVQDFETISDENLIEQVKDYYPELLNE